MSCHKKNNIRICIKIYIKRAPTYFGVTVTPTSWSALICAYWSYSEDRGSSVVKVLCYKSEGDWFDPSRCQWIFHWHKNPCDRTMALGSTQPLTEMSTRRISWGLRRPVLKVDNLPQSCAVVTKSGNLNFLAPSGPVRGLLYVYCLAREMKAVGPFETPVIVNQTTWNFRPSLKQRLALLPSSGTVHKTWDLLFWVLR